MARLLRIGLTGGIASGKSTVSGRFAELGVPVIDADMASRAVVEPGTAGLAQVIERFGSGVLTANGELDRRALRNLIFRDADSRRTLEAIMHPLIRAHMEAAAAAAKGPYLVMAIPLLVEGDRAHGRVDRILVVDVEESVQIERLQTRDGAAPEEARAILGTQASRVARLEAADDVLVNSGSIAELRQAVDALHQRYLTMNPPAAAGGDLS